MGNKLPKPNIPRPNINIPKPTLPKFLQKDSAGAAASAENGGGGAAENNKENVPKIVENDASAAQDEVMFYWSFVGKTICLMTGLKLMLMKSADFKI